MPQSIHGHEVMRMMRESGRLLNKEELAQAIALRFGDEARFHTCALDDLSAHELIEFFESNGKVLLVGSGLQLQEDQVCQDDETHTH